MRTSTLTTLLFFAASHAALSQANHEIWLLQVHENLGELSLSDPQNISQHPGYYDNQPSFLPDGSGLLYSSQQADGQMDVIRYDLATGSRQQITKTPGSEFSPTVTPDGQHFSTIILEQDGTQLLQQYPLAGGQPEVLIPEVVIGYHCWANDTLLLAFVLGESFTLQRCVTTTGECSVVDEHIGRGMGMIPTFGLMSYVSKKDSANWTVSTVNPISGRVSSPGVSMSGTEDIAWRSNGALYRTQGTQLYRWRPSIEPGFEPVADLADLGIRGNLTRLAFSPDGSKLVVVAEEE